MVQSHQELARKREWGTEQRTNPQPTLHTKPTTRTIALGRLGIVVTVIMWVLYVVSTVFRQFLDGPHTSSFILQAVCYLVVVTVLTFSALVYLLLRQGALERFGKHVRTPRVELDHFYAEHQPSMTVLVPSYAEEPEVIRKTLLSAALQEYPHMRVVLLIDDVPTLTNAAAEARLTVTRNIANDLTQWLAEPRERFTNALHEYERHQQGAPRPSQAADGAMQHLAAEYAWAANWLDQKADAEIIDDHVDVFFADQVFRELAGDLRLISQALIVANEQGGRLPEERVLQLYRRLAWTFSAELATFERKHYASLSHEANKAMNLNSYIGLMGGSYHPVATTEGVALVRAEAGQPGAMTIPDSDFLLTLDADSILLREYCLRLAYFLEQPENERVAVAQTPYSSFRGAPTRLERLASATTDVQHILQQGMTRYGATFWVGANAVIRKKALEDIVEKEDNGGFEIKRYIQSRTVIEDTESSIDLALHGWSLVNYPERLSYSATPPDFGSLVIQRRRWANGGLLILPKLWSQIRERRRRGQAVSTAEFWLRLNYMASTAWSTFGLIFLLAFPYDGRLLSPFVVLAALPYFLAMAGDLRYCGYKPLDVLRIYGFNLILLPVNLAGVLKSLQQAITGKRTPFARTPKVKDRTVTPLLFLLAPVAIVAFSAFTLWRDYNLHNWGNAAFAAFNAVVTCWAILAYIGIDHLLADLWRGLTDWFYVTTPAKQAAPAATPAPALDWQAVLYHGNSLEMVPLSVAGTQSESGAK